MPKHSDKKAASDNLKAKPSKICSNTNLRRDLLEKILEDIPSAVIVLEKSKAEIVFVNNRTVELLGINPLGVVIKNSDDIKIFRLNGELFPKQELFFYRALFKGEIMRNVPVLMERKSDGKRLIVNVSATPLYDPDGNINFAVAIFDDVTERVRIQNELKESEKRLNTAQRIAHLGNWEYNGKEDKAVWSEELFHIFGLPLQASGPNLNEYISKIHPDDREKLNEKTNEILKGTLGTKISFDYRIIRKDGAVRILHSERVVSKVDADNKPIVVDGVEQDITERKQTELQLAEYTKNLELLVEERTKQLKAAERLAAIGQTAGMIGHDIRNPLQAIVGDLFLIKQEIDASTDNQCRKNVQESLRSVQEQIDYINKIISDLQDFSRPLKPELTDVDLCITIPKILSTVPLPGNIEVLAFCNEKLPILKLDVTFLKRILLNLVTNAIQAMPNGGKLTVRAFERDRSVFVNVEDTGVGIPEEVKPRIFQPLMTTKSKGQGFGLAVVKRLVEGIGGKISFVSEAGKGSTFTVELPVE